MTELKREDLPLWMQRTLRRTDWGVLLVLVFGLLIVWPFLLQSGLPRTNDSEHYVYRVAEYEQALIEGRLYPRWSPDTLVGYGAPIPNYYPPGAGYLPALVDAFLTGDATLAVMLIYAVAVIAGGASVYAFVTRRTNSAAGVIAALIYMFSPYVGLTAPRVVGDLPGMIALALIPMLLWSVDRLMRLNRPPDLLYVTLISTALLLTDLPSAVIGWLLVAALLAADIGAYTRWSLVVIGGLLSIGIAACFWLPALSEADAIHWQANPRVIPYLLTLRDLITPLRPIDPGALIPRPQFTLGLAIPLFALASLPPIIRQRAGFQALFLVLGLALSVLALVVFPTEVRLLGPISLCLAIAASAVVRWSKAPYLLPVLAILILISAAPVWLTAIRVEPPIDTSAAAQIEYEQQGYGLAVLPAGDPLPTTLAADLAPNRALAASYRGGTINKIDQNSDAQIGLLEHDTHGDRFQVQTFAQITLHYLTAYFPGWSAHFNNAPIQLQPSSDGLIDVSIPSGARGELSITFGPTAPRTLAWVLTWGALALTLALTIRRQRHRSSDPYQPLDLLDNRQARLLALVAVGFVAALLVTQIPTLPINLYPSPNYALTGTSSVDNRSNAGLEVLAYQLDSNSVHPGAAINLTLYWHTLRFLSDDYRARVSLRDPTSGDLDLSSDWRQPGGYPTARWLPRLYVRDPYSFTLPDNFPAGDYNPAVEVCLMDCTATDRLTFFDGRGNSYGQVLVLPVVLHVQ